MPDAVCGDWSIVSVKDIDRQMVRSSFFPRKMFWWNMKGKATFALNSGCVVCDAI